MDHGANPHAPDIEGLTPAAMARTLPRPDIQEALSPTHNVKSRG
jgi:hypothetical protein